MLGHAYLSHYSEYALSSTLSIYITSIAIVLSEYNAASYDTVDFHLFYDGQLICKYEPFQQIIVESLILI